MSLPTILYVESADPVLTKADGVYWELHEALDVRIVTTEGVWRIKIDAGWHTDLLSVPRWLLPALDNGTMGDKKIQLAGIVHDAIYGSNCFSKAIADEYFRQMLMLGGMGQIRAWAYFHAVDLLGDHAYEEDADGEHDRAYIRGWIDAK